MSDFANKSKQPSAKEYLEASEAELIDRLNKNPGNLESEFPFIQSVTASVLGPRIIHLEHSPRLGGSGR